MKLKNQTILITGGSEGIGFELAKQLNQENTVIICGRHTHKLLEAKQLLPEIHIYQCDITDAQDLENLFTQLKTNHPKLNILINNAGGKTATNLASDSAIDSPLNQDLNLNFIAPVKLTHKVVPLLKTQPRACIINITTGLVFIPKAEQAFYCAAKSALHSYTQSLRWAFKDTSIDVKEILMPLVATKFHRGKLPKTAQAISSEKAAREALKGIQKEKHTVLIGKSKAARILSFLLPSIGEKIINT